MLTWVNEQGVRSTRGFVFQRTDRFFAEYREGDKVVTLAVESGLSGGLPCLIIDPAAFARWDDGTPIAAERQTQLFQNVKEAIEFQGLRMVVEKGEAPGEI